MSKHGTLKRKDVRSDGMIFYCYTEKGEERWVSSEKFDELEESRKQNKLKRAETIRLQQREAYHKNKLTHLARCRNWRNKNKKKFAAIKKEYRKNNAESIKSYMKAWKKSNRDRLRQYQKEYYSDRLKHDPTFKASLNIRGLITASLKSTGYKKKSKTASILGCSFAEFRKHLESQFLPGMSWENRSEWHIDHIMPMAMAKTYDEAIRLNHYKNLRPLWAKDNLQKSDKFLDTLVLF
jgi:hypothetical protein